MTLYPPDLPWLSKPDVVREASAAIVAASHAARAYMGDAALDQNRSLLRIGSVA